MNFNIPTAIYTENKCVENHYDLFMKEGKNALIVTGKTSAEKTGALSDAVSALEKTGKTWHLFNKVTENPTDDIVMEIAEFGRNKNIDFIIGIGGGSPIDAAKAASLLIRNPKYGKELLITRADVQHIPIYAVPTTAGTGSEATPYASIIIKESNVKRGLPHRIFPTAAIIDPEYLKYAPVSVFNNTIVDSLGHLLESRLNRKATQYTIMLCDYALSIWGKAAKELLEKSEESNAYGDSISNGTYTNFSVASTIAGMAISHTGTAIPHGLSNFFTIDYGIPHGRAVGLFLVPYLRNMLDKTQVSNILKLIAFSSLDEFENKLIKLIGKVEVSNSDAQKYIGMMISNEVRNCPYIETEKVLKDFFENNKLLKICIGGGGEGKSSLYKYIGGVDNKYTKFPIFFGNVLIFKKRRKICRFAFVIKQKHKCANLKELYR